MAKYKAQSSVYHRLYASLRLHYHKSIEVLPGKESEEINGYAFYALPSFILAVATWESYINQLFFSLWTKTLLGKEIYEKALLIQEAVDKLPVTKKTFLIPLLLFGKTFDKSTSPFQDFDILVKIRNHATHNFMQESPDKPMAALESKGLLLEPRHPSEAQVLTWSEHIQSLEVIRWCINTLAGMSKALVSLHASKNPNWKPFFSIITETDARALLLKHGVSIRKKGYNKWPDDIFKKKG